MSFFSGLDYEGYDRQYTDRQLLRRIAEYFTPHLRKLVIISSLLIIIALASLFGWILAVEEIPQLFSSAILSLTSNPVYLLIIVNVLLLIVGMFLDSTTATLLVVPIIAPPLVMAGVDPIHLGIVTILNLMVGLVTPPLGLSLFMISNIAEIPVKDVLKGVLPFLIPLFISLILITFIPALSLLITNTMN